MGSGRHLRGRDAREPGAELSRLQRVARQHQPARRNLPALAARQRTRRRADRPAHRAVARAAGRGQARHRIRRRVLPGQVRADQRDLLRRLRPPPAAVGDRPHHHVPDRTAVGRGARPVHPPAADRDARGERVDHRTQTLPGRVAHHAARHHRRAVAGGRVRAGARSQARAGGGGQALWALHRRGRIARERPRARRHGRDPALAPRGDQLPASAARTGSGDPRHAGPQCDRHRARAHAEPAAQRARGAVRARHRYRRVAHRRGRVARLHLRHRHAPARALRRAEQDRHPVGRPALRGGDHRRDRPPDALRGDDAGGRRRPHPRRVGAARPGRQDHARSRTARPQPAAGARVGALHAAHSRQAGDHPRDHPRGAPRPARQLARDPRSAAHRRAGAACPRCASCAARTSTSSSR